MTCVRFWSGRTAPLIDGLAILAMALTAVAVLVFGIVFGERVGRWRAASA